MKIVNVCLVFLLMPFVQLIAQDHDTDQTAVKHENEEYISEEEIAYAVSLGTGEGTVWQKLKKAGFRSSHYGKPMEHEIWIMGPVQTLVYVLANAKEEAERANEEFVLSDDLVKKYSTKVITVLILPFAPYYDGGMSYTEGKVMVAGAIKELTIIPIGTETDEAGIRPIRTITENMSWQDTRGMKVLQGGMIAFFDHAAFPRCDIKIVVSGEDFTKSYKIKGKHLKGLK